MAPPEVDGDEKIGERTVSSIMPDPRRLSPTPAALQSSSAREAAALNTFSGFERGSSESETVPLPSNEKGAEIA